MHNMNVFFFLFSFIFLYAPVEYLSRIMFWHEDFAQQ